MKYFTNILCILVMVSLTACTPKSNTPTQVSVVDAAQTEKLIVMQPVVVTPDPDVGFMSGGVESLPANPGSLSSLHMLSAPMSVPGVNASASSDAPSSVAPVSSASTAPVK